jgi:hypothetical protein
MAGYRPSANSNWENSPRIRQRRLRDDLVTDMCVPSLAPPLKSMKMEQELCWNESETHLAMNLVNNRVTAVPRILRWISVVLRAFFMRHEKQNEHRWWRFWHPPLFDWLWISSLRVRQLKH